jgi:hypothetical protein
VQLFPFAFWQETAIAVGVTCVVVATVVAVVATLRISAMAGSAAAASPQGDSPAVGSEPAR